MGVSHGVIVTVWLRSQSGKAFRSSWFFLEKRTRLGSANDSRDVSVRRAASEYSEDLWAGQMH